MSPHCRVSELMQGHRLCLKVCVGGGEGETGEGHISAVVGVGLDPQALSCCRDRSGGEGRPARPSLLPSGDHPPAHMASFPATLACTRLRCRYCITSERRLDSY